MKHNACMLQALERRDGASREKVHFLTLYCKMLKLRPRLRRGAAAPQKMRLRRIRPTAGRGCAALQLRCIAPSAQLPANCQILAYSRPRLRRGICIGLRANRYNIRIRTYGYTRAPCQNQLVRSSPCHYVIPVPATHPKPWRKSRSFLKGG